MKKRSRQKGVAAIEFALIAVLMLVLFSGLMIFWHFFQVHQVVTRVVGDAARMTQSMITLQGHYPCAPHPTAQGNRALIQQRAEQVVRQSLQHSDVPESALQSFSFQWSCPSGSVDGTAKIEMVYAFRPIAGQSFLESVPLHVKEESVIHFKPLN